MRANSWFVVAVVGGILGSATSRVEARGAVTITYTGSTPPLATYAPNNVVAAWIEGPGGTFIKTIDRQSLVRTQHLVAWQAKAGNVDMDAVSGATRVTLNQPVTATWNLLDKQGQPGPDGTYPIRLELAPGNANTAGQNNQGTFTFVKGPAAQTQTNLANGGFTNVMITYDPAAPACGDGLVDAPETCDGNCPATCTAADACMPQRKTGTAAMCNVECVAAAPITTCIDDDGCCPAGCEAEDTDCDAGGTGGGGGGGTGGGNNPDETTEVTGGCSTGGRSSALLFGLSLAALSITRRRR